METQNISLAHIRPLGVVLAHCLGQYKVGRNPERLELLNRLYIGSDPIVQLQCRAELLNMRQARLDRITAVEASSNG